MQYRILALAFFLTASQCHADSLMDAVRSAGAKNAEIQAAMYQQYAASEKRWQGIAGLLPSLQMNGSYNVQDQPNASYAAKVKRHDYALVVNQQLFDLSKYADFIRGQQMADKGDIELLKSQQKVMNDVAEVYSQVLYFRDVKHAAHIAASAYDQQLKKAKTAIRLGDVTRIDVDEAQANLDVALAKEIEAGNELVAAGNRYSRLTGLSYLNIQSIPEQCLIKQNTFQTRSEKSLFNKALATNVDIRLAQSSLDMADTDVLSATSAHMPVVRLQASYGSNWSRGEDQNELDSLFGTTSKTTNTNIGINVSVPIFSGGMQLSQSREASYKREEARYTLIDMRQKIKEDLATAILSIRNNEALFNSTKRIIHSEENKVASTAMGKSMGIRTQIDELNAQQRYYEAIKNNAEAKMKLLNSKVNLVKVTGDLGYTSLSEITCVK